MDFSADVRTTECNTIDHGLSRLEQLGPGGISVGLHIRFGAPLVTAYTYPEDWLRIYTGQGYALRDPLIGWGLGTEGAARWSEIELPDPFGIWDQARSFGLNFGAAVAFGPLSSRSIVGISRSDRELTDSEIQAARSIVEEIHIAACPPVELTKAQVEALRCIADGDRLAAAAYRLGISESAIKARLASVRQRLDVRTMPEAIQKARQFRLI